VISLRSRFPRQKSHSLTKAITKRFKSFFLRKESSQKNVSRPEGLKRGSVSRLVSRTCDDATRYLGVAIISGYQKFISPHKGFRCAHRVLYGGESCSAYIKRIAAEAGVIPALRSLKPRFAECRCAYETIKANRQQTAPVYSARRTNWGSNDNLTYALAMSQGGGGNLGDGLGDNSEGSSGEPPQKPQDNPPENNPEIPGEMPPPKTSQEGVNPEVVKPDSNCCSGSGVDTLAECTTNSCIDLSCDGIDAIISESCNSISCDGLDCGALDCGSCG
jgi:putative component of membrane protein insertase Oxa1/YidC/SpoIIIJ protein YidD